jgi:hypothetical protein
MTQRLCHKCQAAPQIIGLISEEGETMAELCGDCFKQFAEEAGSLWIEARVFYTIADEDRVRAAIESIRNARKLAHATPGGTA